MRARSLSLQCLPLSFPPSYGNYDSSRAHERNVNYDNINLISLQNQFRFSVVAGVLAVNIENGFCDLLVSIHCCYKCLWILY